MVDSPRQGMYPSQGLSSRELQEISGLTDLCRIYDNFDLKLNKDTLESRPADKTSDFLYYENDRLVGFLPIFNYNPAEAEISGMVHPDFRRRGIFTQLYQAAMKEIRRRGVPLVLLIAEHWSVSGQAFCAKQQATYHHSEYKMLLGEPRFPELKGEPLEIRTAHEGEEQLLALITARGFGLPEEIANWFHFPPPENRFYYLGFLRGIAVGKVDIYYGKDAALIMGLAVLPEYQGQGYGRQILSSALRTILATGQKQLELEVLTDNESALSLYQSCGFEQSGRDDYYSLQL